jgi:hypothetical protein
MNPRAPACTAAWTLSAVLSALSITTNAGINGKNLVHRLQTVLARHADIQKHDIGARPLV